MCPGLITSLMNVGAESRRPSGRLLRGKLELERRVVASMAVEREREVGGSEVTLDPVASQRSDNQKRMQTM